MVYITMEHNSATKRRNNAFAATWMNPEIIIPNEISQIKKHKYLKISLIHGIKKNDRNELTYKTEINPQI